MKRTRKYTHVWQRCSHCDGIGKVAVIDTRWLRSMRRISGLTYRAIATRLGISAAYLCDIEHGKRNCPDRVARFYLKLEARGDHGQKV